MNIYKTGPTGRSIFVADGVLQATICPSGGIFPYDYGPGGYSINVDSLGRLVVALDGVGSSYIEDDLSSQLDNKSNEFIFRYSPVVETITIYRNGVLCKIGQNNDFVTSVSGTLVTNFIPRSGGSLMAYYCKKE